MGMYTELKGTIVFKNQEIAEAFSDSWGQVFGVLSLREVEEFKNYSRSGFIPNGVIYSVGNVVKFHTELKNYDSTIEKFLDLLPLIADNWMLESKYEESSHWVLHRKDKNDVSVNGDNSWILYWSTQSNTETYPDFDVFNLENL